MSKGIYWYQKIIRSAELRYAMLNMVAFLPDRIMLALQYWIKLGRRCGFDNPRRWTEKLQLYKMYYRNPILSQCVDKYRVRSYIKVKGLENNLVKLYGAFKSSKEIDIEKLPKSFVIKTNNGGGGLNVDLIMDKDAVDLKSIFAKYDKWISDFKPIRVPPGREWAYTGIKEAYILIEELLVNKNNPTAGIEDFKILCFQGEPKYIIVDKDRYSNHKRNFYDTSWKRINVTTDHEQFETPYPRPKNFEKMLEIARKLSLEFPFVRVDLYNVDGQIYFGELTFYPWTGYVQFLPDEFDFTLGKLMDCSSFMPNK